MVGGVGQIGRLSVLMELNAARFQAGIQQVQNSMNRMERSIKRFTRNLGGAFTAVGVVQLGRAAVTAGLQMQRMETALRSVTGSHEAAAREMAFMKARADELGLSLLATGRGYANLTAATKGTNLEGEQTRRLFEGVTAAARALALTADDTNGVLRAFTQVVSKGKVQAEELRGQIGERLPGAFQLAADAMGVTTQQLDKMMSLGRITAEDLLPKLADAMINKYGKAAIEAAEGPAAAFERFGNLMVEIGAALSEILIPPLVVVAKALRGIVEAVKFVVRGFQNANPYAEQMAAKMRELKDETEGAQVAMRKLTAAQLALRRMEITDQISQLTEQLRRAQEAASQMSLLDMLNPFNTTAERAELLKRTISGLEKQWNELTRQMEELQTVEDGITESTDKLGESLETATEKGKRFGEVIGFSDRLREFFDAAEEVNQILIEAGAVYDDVSKKQMVLDKALAAGLLTWEQYSDAVFEAQGALDDAGKSADEGNHKIESWSDTLADLIIDFKNFRENLKRILKRILNDILASGIEKALKRIFGSIFGGGTGGAESLIGGVLNLVGGSGSGGIFGGLGGLGGVKDVVGSIFKGIGGIFKGGAGGGGIGGLSSFAGAAVPLGIAGFGLSQLASSRKQKEQANSQFFSSVGTGTMEQLNPSSMFRGLDEATGEFFITLNEGWNTTLEALGKANVLIESQGALYDEAGNELVKMSGDVEGVRMALSNAKATGFEFAGSLTNAIEKGNNLRVSIQGDADTIRQALEAATAAGIGGFKNFETTATGVSATLTGDIAKWNEFLQSFVNSAVQAAISGVGALGDKAGEATLAFLELANAAAGIQTGGGLRVAVDGKHDRGLREVPRDGYLAQLHRGERVLTAAEARQMDRGTESSGRVESLLSNILRELRKGGMAREGFALA